MRNSAWPLSKDWSEVLLERKQRLEKWSLTNTSGWPWRQKKKEEQDWRMIQQVVTNKHLRLAVETEEERRARLENDAATKRLSLAMYTDEERKARLKKMVATKSSSWPWRRTKKEKKTGEDFGYHTAQIGLGDGRRKKRKNGLNLIWIEIGFFLIQGMSPLTL